jgi:membrane protease YdiL (CAAX protease family)
MTPSDDNPLLPSKNAPEDLSSEAASPSGEAPAHFSPADPDSVADPLLSGDPISLAAVAPVQPTEYTPPSPYIPEDLRIPWSWPHLILFIFFFFASQFVALLLIAGYYESNRHLSQRQLQHLLESSPPVIVGMTVLSSALTLLFLYVTLSLLRGLPFWHTLGWRPLGVNPATHKRRPWLYFFSGSALAVFVAIASSRTHEAENAPIQQLFKNRGGALLLMSMAVFVAPFFEETVFRGYLYPVFVRIISAVARFFGVPFEASTRFGIAASILLTGTLFGLLHAPQLGWTLGLVSLLILVGIVLTFIRARTGTVLASFLVHLGYNSMIAVTSIIATRGFSQLPPTH